MTSRAPASLLNTDVGNILDMFDSSSSDSGSDSDSDNGADTRGMTNINNSNAKRPSNTRLQSPQAKRTVASSSQIQEQGTQRQQQRGLQHNNSRRHEWTRENIDLFRLAHQELPYRWKAIYEKYFEADPSLTLTKVRNKGLKLFGSKRRSNHNRDSSSDDSDNSSSHMTISSSSASMLSRLRTPVSNNINTTNSNSNGDGSSQRPQQQQYQIHNLHAPTRHVSKSRKRTLASSKFRNLTTSSMRVPGMVPRSYISNRRKNNGESTYRLPSANQLHSNSTPSTEQPINTMGISVSLLDLLCSRYGQSSGEFIHLTNQLQKRFHRLEIPAIDHHPYQGVDPRRVHSWGNASVLKMYFSDWFLPENGIDLLLQRVRMRVMDTPPATTTKTAKKSIEAPNVIVIDDDSDDDKNNSNTARQKNQVICSAYIELATTGQELRDLMETIGIDYRPLPRDNKYFEAMIHAEDPSFADQFNLGASFRQIPGRGTTVVSLRNIIIDTCARYRKWARELWITNLRANLTMFIYIKSLHTHAHQLHSRLIKCERERRNLRQLAMTGTSPLPPTRHSIEQTRPKQKYLVLAPIKKIIDELKLTVSKMQRYCMSNRKTAVHLMVNTIESRYQHNKRRIEYHQKILKRQQQQRQQQLQDQQQQQQQHDSEQEQYPEEYGEYTTRRSNETFCTLVYGLIWNTLRIVEQAPADDVHVVDQLEILDIGHAIAAYRGIKAERAYNNTRHTPANVNDTRAARMAMEESIVMQHTSREPTRGVGVTMVERRRGPLNNDHDGDSDCADYGDGSDREEFDSDGSSDSDSDITDDDQQFNNNDDDMENDGCQKHYECVNNWPDCNCCVHVTRLTQETVFRYRYQVDVCRKFIIAVANRPIESIPMGNLITLFESWIVMFARLHIMSNCNAIASKKLHIKFRDFLKTDCHVIGDFDSNHRAWRQYIVKIRAEDGQRIPIRQHPNFPRSFIIDNEFKPSLQCPPPVEHELDVESDSTTLQSQDAMSSIVSTSSVS